MTLKKCLPLIMALALLIAGCGSMSDAQSDSHRPDTGKRSGSGIQLTEQEKPLIDATNRFAFGLYEQLTASGEDRNVFVSPLSIAIALSMTNNGANGDTREAISRTLQQRELSVVEVNRSYQAILQALEKGEKGIVLNIANSLWAREGYEFHETFLQTNKQYYGAETRTLDFSDAQAANKINGWVKKATRDRIPEVVQAPISDDVILYLINAIYFKGNWTEPFDPAMTSEETFHLADGSTKRHPLMKSTDRFSYQETDLFQAVKLPYGSKQISMVVLLPREGRSLSDLHNSLSAEQWESWMNGFSQRRGTLELPRFKMAYETSLVEPLKAMGMGIAFDQELADFSRMADVPPNIFLSEVKHKSFVEVNEKGTEAAAVTVVEASASGAAPPSEPFHMKVDRPFFFAIVENQQGAVLFMGSVYEPEE